MFKKKKGPSDSSTEISITQTDQDLKRKYYNALDDLERNEHLLKEAENLIRQTVSRLSVAAQGHSDRLDVALEELRDLVRNELNYATIHKALGRIADLLAEHTDLGLAQQEAGPVIGASEITLASELLEGLLERLVVPNELEEERQNLAEMAGQISDEQGAFALLDKTAQLINNARALLQEEKKELGRYLQQLQDTLSKIDGQMAAQVQALQEHGSEREAVHEAVNGHVSRIENQVDIATSLNELKKIVQEHLTLIRDQMSSYQQSDGARLQAAEKTAEELRAQVNKMEQEASALRKELQKKRQQMLRDPLTGIFNRMAWDERVQYEFARWQRYGSSLCIMVCDIDHFKRINDTYGHKSGDKAIMLVARQLQKNLRDADFLARYGGEEFAILIPATEVDGAILVAEKLRTSIAELDFHHAQKKVDVTISIGVTEFRSGDSATSAFERADEALYKAKQEGRNRVIRL